MFISQSVLVELCRMRLLRSELETLLTSKLTSLQEIKYQYYIDHGLLSQDGIFTR